MILITLKMLYKNHHDLYSETFSSLQANTDHQAVALFPFPSNDFLMFCEACTSWAAAA